MRGVFVELSSRSRTWNVPAENSVLGFLLDPLLDQLSGLYWLCLRSVGGVYDFVGALMEGHDEGALESKEVELPCQGETEMQLLRPGFMPDLGPFIRNDHLELIAMAGSEGEVRQGVDEFIRTSRSLSRPEEILSLERDFVLTHAVIWIVGVDGVRYEFRCCERGWLVAIGKQAASLQAVTIGELPWG